MLREREELSVTKTILLTVSSIFLTLIALTTSGQEVEIRQAPATWQQVAQDDGGDLYGELCASCHGADGRGQGPAAPALNKPVADLTGLAKQNGGVFPWDRVVETIRGDNRVVSHGSVEMPIWGQVFTSMRPDWKPARREAFAHQRIYNLAAYIESIQAN